MTQNKINLRNTVRKYLKQKGVKAIEFNGGLRIIVLKSNGVYHYCSIEMGGISDPEFYQKNKPFEFYIISSDNIHEITSKVSKYIGQ